MFSRSIDHPGPIVAIAIIWLSIISCTSAFAETADHFTQIEKILGAKGEVKQGTLVVRYPRSDVQVTVNGEHVPTGLGLDSWIAWANIGDNVLVIGNLVLLDKEVNPVISALEGARIDITALHNDFLGEKPGIVSIHFNGIGRAQDLARGVKNALSKTATPQPTGEGASELSGSPLDTKRIENIMGHSGKSSGGAFKIIVGRSGVRSHGLEMTAGLGMNSWAGFVGTSERAHVSGDIAATASEVNRVVRTLRNGGLEVVAVNNHMLDEEPRMFFIRYWGTGPSEELAQTVRAAFDQVERSAR
ncbi:MAG: DUF1259 domain-containing protein [Desulfomonilaceae bacterium]